MVKARITVDASGNVTQVEVLEARPRTLFDRSVIDALSQWKFAKGPAGRTLETQVDFRR
jgi:protein TonB